MQPRFWGVPLVILALLGGVALGMRQAGVTWPWQVTHPRVGLRADLGSEARLGSPVDAAPLPAPPGVTLPAPNPGVDPGRPPVPVEGEVVYLGDRGRAILTGKSGTLLVTGSDGKELLRQSADGLEGWWSWQAGGTTLLWLRYYDTGALRLNRVFRYDPGPDRFVAVGWEDEGTEHRGALTFVAEGSYLQESAPVAAHHTRTLAWRYAGLGKLVAVPGAYQLSDANWYPGTPDGLLAAFLESVGMRLPDEARRYFADPAQADSYYRILTGQVLSYGHAHVLLGDALDPKKQEYPFFLDMEGVNPGDSYFYISLQGSASLKATADGKRLQLDTWQYSVVPEPFDRQRAIALVRSLPEVRALPAGTSPTLQIAHGYTHWNLVFASGGPVYEVDSRTGDAFRLTQDGRKVPVNSRQ